MTDPARTATCVEILARDEAARRLVLAWHLVAPALKDREMLRAWSEVSGIPARLVQRLAPVLFGHALCREDRTADPEALRIVQHVAAMYLRATGGKR